MKEIERKWIVKSLPINIDQTPLLYERHFLFNQDGIEIRIQKKGEVYEFERKVEVSDLTREGQKFIISPAEFESLKKISTGSIIRESIVIDGISVKAYKGKFSGLIRAEVEFNNEHEAQEFIPPVWFGTEITNSVLGMDKRLMMLSEAEFTNELRRLGADS
jgi:adenylate cyclase